jgi:Tfp pilus assembly protein PilP
MMKLIVFFLIMTSIGANSAPVANKKNFFKDKTSIENPFNLRDPFKPPFFKNEGKRKAKGFNVVGQGQYSNIREANLEQMAISQLKVMGVLIGKERRAMVSLDGKGVVIVKEGVRIGPERAELKAILPGGIVLVEKIVNVYGEEEFLETVIPISK